MTQSKPKRDERRDDAEKPLPADMRQLQDLVDLMVTNDLSRLELRQGDTHILLRRGQTPGHHPIPAHAAPASAPHPPAHSAPPPAESTNEILIRSPMVGTFYTAPDPASPAFVEAGSVVTPDTVVCIVEAMKVFNEIKAEVAGRITKVLVKNAEPVEFDQPLFAVGPA
jgi:acetyl-CoA carboxylase biotin carboxyl carrier protein